jgi:predicted Zn-ribbon and HTH transcriptional regulator
MILCPKCKGYGKTVSTRNEPDKVIRWHKCRDCGFTFTSTQTVDDNYKDTEKDKK